MFDVSLIITESPLCLVQTFNYKTICDCCNKNVHHGVKICFSREVVKYIFIKLFFISKGLNLYIDLFDSDGRQKSNICAV